MAVNTTITYGDLIQQVKTKLVAIAKNESSKFASQVPAEYKANYSQKKVVSRSGSGGFQRETVESGITANISNAIGSVSADTIRSQLDTFLQQRGISDKSSTKITTRGLLNFYNNVAAFCTAKLRLAQGTPFTTKPAAVIVYVAV